MQAGVRYDKAPIGRQAPLAAALMSQCRTAVARAAGSPAIRLARRRAGSGAPARTCYWVTDVVVFRVVVTATGGGYVVVFVTLSDATPLVLL